MIYKRGRIWWVRWRGPDGHMVQQTTSTRNKAVAQGMNGVIEQLQQAREWDVLRAVQAGTVSLGHLYDERVDMTRIKTTLDDIDLRPLVEEWRRHLENRKIQSATRYCRQVMAYLNFRSTRSTFDRANLSHWLNQSLSTGTSSTRNRYRAALSAFGSWLVETGRIPLNPLREVRGFTSSRPRTTHVEREQAKRLILALPSPQREQAALMAGTGMEQQAVFRLRMDKVEAKQRPPRLFANGGKNEWRQRWVRFTEAWAWPLFKPALEGKAAHALVFGRGTPAGDNTLGASLDYHVRKVLAHEAFADFPKLTPHDFRHCYAVWNLRDGMNPKTVQHQLGHAKLSMTIDVYGNYIPDRDSDYETHAKRSAK